MSAALLVSYREPELPWAGSPEDDQRFRKVLQVVWALCIVLCLIVLFMPVVVPDRKEQALPEQMTTMILDHVKQLPVPPVPEEVAKSDLPKALEKEAVVNPKEHKQKPAPEARIPMPNKPAGEIDAARRKVAGIGLLASSKDLDELRGAPMAVQINPVKPGPGVGSGTGVGVGAGNEAGVPVRALITSNAAGGSGGINTSGYSSNTGGGGLAGRSTTLVEGAIGGGGGGGAGRAGSAGAQAGLKANAGGSVQRGNSGKASRSIEEIKLVFEKNKGAIYSIYNRALREEPGLQGKVVLELKIAPGGNVLECRIVSSELKSPELEAKLLARIRQFDFGAKDVDQMNVTWPVDFLPS
ncbi:TonB family protein [Oxalobacteraceae bacterium GrIS 2.11]